MDQYCRTCPLCGSDDASTVVSIYASQIIASSPYYDDSSYARLNIQPQAKFGISRCNDCTFTFASAKPSDEFLEKLYGDVDEIERSVKVYARPARAAYAFNALSRLLNAISRRFPTNAPGMPDDNVRILDVGCAFGAASLGLTLPYYPYEISGVELAKSTRAYLSKQGMKAYRSLEEIPDGSSFDGILLNDVLEHIADPVPFIAQIRRVCSPQTVVWVNVPNFIDWRLFQIAARVSSGNMDIPKDLNPWEHLSYFSPKTLDELMQKVGFRRVSESTVEYLIKCDSPVEILKSLMRMFRDIWRIYKKRYPREFSTSALFELEPEG